MNFFILFPAPCRIKFFPGKKMEDPPNFNKSYCIDCQYRKHSV